MYICMYIYIYVWIYDYMFICIYIYMYMNMITPQAHPDILAIGGRNLTMVC